MLTVYDFCTMCNDDFAAVRIYDTNESVEAEVFAGTMRDAAYHDDYGCCDVNDFDIAPNGEITLNIDTTED